MKQGIVGEFAERLRRMRENLGLTQEQFAEKVGKSRGAISLYEKGDRTPDIEFLWDVTMAFDCDYSDLMGMTERMKYEKTGLDNKARLSKGAVDIVRNYVEEINFLASYEDLLEDIFEAIAVYRNTFSVESIALTGSEYTCYANYAKGALEAGLWEAQKEGYWAVSEYARVVLNKRIKDNERLHRKIHETIYMPPENADEVLSRMNRDYFSSEEILTLKKLKKAMEEAGEHDAPQAD